MRHFPGDVKLAFYAAPGVMIMSAGAIIFYSDQVIPENERLDRRFLEMVNKDRPKLAYIPSASAGTRRYY